jgi:hypothetical protein
MSRVAVSTRLARGATLSLCLLAGCKNSPPTAPRVRLPSHPGLDPRAVAFPPARTQSQALSPTKGNLLRMQTSMRG